MHIVIGFLGAVVTILVLLSRLADAGYTPASFNPFLWHRRHKWRQTYEGNPLFKIDQPMDATALLMVAVAKADGDLAREDKANLLERFESKFELGREDASALMVSSVHLLGDGTALPGKIDKLLERSLDKFTPSQQRIAIELIDEAASYTGSRHPSADRLVDEARRALTPPPEKSSAW